CSSFFIPYHVSPPLLHSFPTRRSSDLLQHPGVRRHQLGQDLAAQCARVLHPGRRTGGHGGGHRRAVAESSPRGAAGVAPGRLRRSEEHTSELQSRENLVCRLLLEKKNK